MVQILEFQRLKGIFGRFIFATASAKIRFDSSKMKTFTEKEVKLIGKLRRAPSQTTLDIREPCPNHSACNPLPLFRLYRVSEESFEAQWNTHHRRGPTQTFAFADVNGG